MLSDVVAGEIDKGLLGLIRGRTLFVEQGKGDAFMVVKTTANVDVETTIPGVHRASIQLLLTGYGMEPGFKMMNDAAAIVEALQGDYSYKGEQYHIYSVVVKSRPVVFTQERVLKHSCNFTVSYRAG